MERHKIFHGENTGMPYQIDEVMDSINRNFQEFGSFLTTQYGINMQENPDALKVEIIGGPDYIVYPGKALSSQFNMIINGSNKSFKTELDALYSPPVENDTAYIYITKKEVYEPTSEITFVNPNYDDAEPYETWYVDNNIIPVKTQTGPDSDSILLALLTYNGSIWVLTTDFRLQTQFVITSGIAIFISHILSAHTACLHPVDITALDPAINGTSIDCVAIVSGEYVYSGGEIYTSLISYSYDFSGKDTGWWYYLYVLDQNLAIKKAGNEYIPGPDSLVDAGLDDEKYLVICSVWWSSVPVLTDLIDLRASYYLPTRANQIRVSPTSGISARNVQAAISELDSEKLAIDGSMTMINPLDMGYNNIINVHNILLAESGMIQNSPKHIIQSADNPLHLNTTTSFDKGIRLEANGDVHIQGQVKSDIDMADGKTVDGIDLSELKLGRIYDYVVDRIAGSATGGPEDSPTGSVGFEYALIKCAADPGKSVFVKNPPGASYTFGEDNQSYTLAANTTIIGENPDKTKIDIGASQTISFGSVGSPNNYFNVENLRFDLADNTVTLNFYDKGVLRNCWLELSGTTPTIWLGRSKFFNLNASAPTSSAHATIVGSKIMGCVLNEVEVDYISSQPEDDYTTVVNGSFYKVIFKGSYSSFTNCISSFGSSPYGWNISAWSATYPVQFCKLANCSGDIYNNNTETTDANQTHFMIAGHKGTWSYAGGDGNMTDKYTVVYTSSYYWTGSAWWAWGT